MNLIHQINLKIKLKEILIVNVNYYIYNEENNEVRIFNFKNWECFCLYNDNHQCYNKLNVRDEFNWFNKFRNQIERNFTL